VLVTDEGGGGHGLVGMRERAALFGGTLSAGPRNGRGFEVRAVLPYPDREGAP
jgi:signal transduction histidine kinase